MKERKSLKLPLASVALVAVSFALLNSHTTALSGIGSPATKASAAANGATIFSAKCSLCHGKDGVGLSNWRAKGQPDFKSADWQKSRTDAQIMEAIKNGKGKYMPAFKTKLSDEEIAAVVGTVRAFGKRK